MHSDRKFECLDLDNADTCKAWIISFEALCRSKALEDKASATGTSEVTDAFLSRCGAKALLKIMSLMPSKNVEKMMFKEVKKIIEDYVAPRKRLVIADRTNFLQLSQTEDEPVVDFLSRLNEASIFCQWNDLKLGEPCEELIKLRFIAGLKDASLKVKILEKLQLDPTLDITNIVDFCQMDAQVAQFADIKSSIPGNSTLKSEVLFVKDDVCGRCGSAHKPKQCPAFRRTCAKCHKVGHFAKMCKSNHNDRKDPPIYQRKKKYNKNMQSHNVDTFTVGECSDAIIQEFHINGKLLKFQIDTGASMSIMSDEQWKEIGAPDLSPSNLQPTNYDGSQIETLGEIDLEVEMDAKCKCVKFIVVKANKNYGLIGRNVIDKHKSHIETLAVDDQGLPTIKGFTASIALKDPSVTLKFFRARPVPLHLKEVICNELDSLEKQGIITPIKFSNHASPVVWVKKADGHYRMCVDFKATINSNILSDAYPLPTTEEIFGRVGNASKFAKVDLKSAYWQMELDADAKQLSVVNTTKGLYTVNRLQMGMKNASAIFQRCIEHIVKGLNGVIAYQDDVLVCADSSSQLNKRLSQLRKRLQEYNVTVNEKKCVEETDSLNFLGFIFSKAGIKPDCSLLAKISEMPTPKNNKELSSFLGLVNYYGRFVKNFADLCAPLYNLKKTSVCDEFEWNAQCEKSFTLLKKALLSEPVLMPFSLQKQTVLTVDASGVAIGAVLSQDSHPVIFISRKLTDAETRYSNIEREGLAVIWACNRLEHFLLGKRFIIKTDHKPLIWIFGSETAVKTNISPRLLNFSLQLMRFDYDIQHIKGNKNVIADTLSRIDHSDNTFVPQVNFTVPNISVDLLRRESGGDRFLADLRKRIINGNWRRLSSWENHFKPFINELSIDDDNIIRIGSKVVPPRSLYSDIIKVAHQTHSGIHATTMLISREFFWPFMSKIIRNYIVSCGTCNAARFPKCDTTHQWPNESTPWTRLHIDWAFTQHTGNILVVADSHSGWLEAITTHGRTTTIVINILRSIFARFGVPSTLVTDNAPEFTSKDFKMWLSSIGCRLIHSPEYHPQSNGLAERMVRVLKDALKCYNSSKCSVNAFVHRFLFVHRNTAQRGGKTPAEILLGRTVRCPILSEFQPMQPIMYKCHQQAAPKMVKFLFRQGANTSLVAHENNRAVLAHDSQLAAVPYDLTTDDAVPGDSSTEPRRSIRTKAPPQLYGERYFH